MKINIFLSIILSFISSVAFGEVAEMPVALTDSVAKPHKIEISDSVVKARMNAFTKKLLGHQDCNKEHTGPSSTLWMRQVVCNGFHINDTTIQYPKFPRFLLNVYNWGDSTFNSYDPEYVVGTGKNWKLQMRTANWFEAVSMHFKNGPLRLLTHLYADAGPSLSFMAVSYSYMINVNELLGVPTRRSTWNFDFMCSRFALTLNKQNCSGDMTITRLGDYNDGKRVHLPFNDGSFSSTYLTGFYFFNHRKYSHAAAYSYSKYQRKSAGSWLAGFTYDTKNAQLDFTKLPIDHPENLADMLSDFRFHYSDYQLSGGYAYNFVLPPHNWLLNLTGLLSMGYRHTYDDSSEGNGNMVANNFRVMMAAVYNHKALFVSPFAKFRGNFFYTSQYIYFNHNLNFGFNVGMRF